MPRFARSACLAAPILALAPLLATAGIPAAAGEIVTRVTLDRSFGEDGTATVPLDVAGNEHAAPYLGASDGRGGSLLSLIGEENVLVRLDEHGDLDPTFAGDGAAELPPDTVPIALDATEAGIVLVLGATDRDQAEGIVLRFHADGTPDVRFGADGLLDLGAGGARLEAVGVELTDDGGVILSVTRMDADGPAEAGFLVRYRVDGSLDPGFGIGGLVALEPFGGFLAGGIVVDRADRIIVGASTEADDATVWVRLLPSGALDPTWGHAGITRVPATKPTFGILDGDVVTWDRDGAVAFADRYQVVRLGPDGRLDRRFDGDGIITIDEGDRLNHGLVALDGGDLAASNQNEREPMNTVVAVVDSTGFPLFDKQTPVDPENAPILFGSLWGSNGAVVAGNRFTELSGPDPDPVPHNTLHRYTVVPTEVGPTVSAVAAGRSSLDVSWVASEHEADPPVRLYSVQAERHGEVVAATAVAGDARRVTLTGLNDGQAVEVTVTPYTDRGIGVRSLPVSGTPSATAPAPVLSGPVQGLAGVGGQRFATVTWSAPASDGGSPVQAYAVVAAKAGTSEVVAWQARPADVRVASVPSLQAGSAYDIYVFPWTAALGYGSGAKVTVTPNNLLASAGQPPTVPWIISQTLGQHRLAAVWGAPAERGRVTDGFAVIAVRDGVGVGAAVAGREDRSLILDLSGEGPVDLYVAARSGASYGPLTKLPADPNAG